MVALVSERLFEPNLVYPSDRDGGRYVELEGTLIEVRAPLSEKADYPCKVQTTKGVFDAFTGYVGSFVPEVGQLVTVRIYDAGGGWYPDNRITSRRTP